MRTLRDELRKWERVKKKKRTSKATRRQVPDNKVQSQKPNGKKRDKANRTMSRREWEEIMGVFRPTYERRRGAIRRR